MNRELINTIRKTSTAPIPAVKAYKAENVASGNIKGVPMQQNRFVFSWQVGRQAIKNKYIQEANAAAASYRERYGTYLEESDRRITQGKIKDMRVNRLAEMFNNFSKTGRIDDIDTLLAAAKTPGASGEIYQQFIDKIADLMSDYYFTGFVADKEFQIQCAGLMKGIMSLLFNWEGSIGNGGEVAYNVANTLSGYFDFYKYENDEQFFDAIKENPLAAGSIVSEPSIGHVYTTIGRNVLNDKYYILEQAGLHAENVHNDRWLSKDFLGRKPTIVSQIDDGEQAYGMLPRIMEDTPFHNNTSRKREVAVPKGPAAGLFNDIYRASMDKITRRHNAVRGLGKTYTNMSKEAAKYMNPDLR